MKRSAAVLIVLAACTATPVAPPERSPTSSLPTSVAPSPTARPAVFDGANAVRTLRVLAARGPREATSAAYRRAAVLVEERFTAAGLRVGRQAFSVPRGVSWGVPVPAGHTFNVVAQPPGFDARRPHLLVGAHLDTVPQSPGANDNASGISILLELANLLARQRSPLPVVLVAFGAEEPRAPGDDGHHYGSRYYASRLTRGEANALLGVISIDRVGAGERALVCTGGRSPLALRDALLTTAQRLDLPARACDNRTSDHWPFERAGETVARLDGGRFPGYHSSRDVASRVSSEQVARVGAIVWETLRRLRAADVT